MERLKVWLKRDPRVQDQSSCLSLGFFSVARPHRQASMSSLLKDVFLIQRQGLQFIRREFLRQPSADAQRQKGCSSHSFARSVIGSSMLLATYAKAWAKDY